MPKLITGQCPKHPRSQVVDGKKSCQQCLDAYKSRRKNLRASGKCSQHPKEDAIFGTTKCLLCRERNLERINSGRCVNHPNVAAVKTGQSCQKCIDTAVARKYGVDKKSYQEMVAKFEEFGCPICLLTKPRPSLDHCHKTGKIREVICQNCNLLLGHAKDSQDILNMAILYLERHKRTNVTI